MTGDYYVCAFPVDVMCHLLNDDLIAAAPELAGIKKLNESTQWMNGIQFYLLEDIPLVNGHVAYMDTPWALTSVSQRQFWKDVDFTQMGDGRVQGILSIDVSDWTTPGHNGKKAMDCTPDEVAAEVWYQLKQGLNAGGQEILRDDLLHSWFIDPDIHFENPHSSINIEPLLVNQVGTWELRPEATTSIPNLFLASDYVRTNTDLASMEAANEAARRAVNGILTASGSDEKPCEIFPMYTMLK